MIKIQQHIMTQIDFNSFDVVIFDCDGVLVDSESLSCYALNIVFEEVFQIDIGSDYSNVIGTSLEQALKFYLNKYKILDFDINHLKEMKEEAYFSLAKESLQTFDGCLEFVKLLRDKEFIIAVASSGSHKKIRYSLSLVSLEDQFEQIYSTQDVIRGKPYPDIFLHAANDLGVSPDRCLVIEDSINGIKAAQNAKMSVIAFPGSFSADQLIETGAYYVKGGYLDLIDILQSK